MNSGRACSEKPEVRWLTSPAFRSLHAYYRTESRAPTIAGGNRRCPVYGRRRDAAVPLKPELLAGICELVKGSDEIPCFARRFLPALNEEERAWSDGPRKRDIWTAVFCDERHAR